MSLARIGFPAVALVLVACGGPRPVAPTAPAERAALADPTPTDPPSMGGTPTVEEATRFVAEVDRELRRLKVWGSRIGWVKQTYITDDTDALSADAEEAYMEYVGRVIPLAARYDGLPLPPPVRRQLELLKRATSLPAPKDPAKRAALAKISVELDSMYGKGKYCPEKGSKLEAGGKCLVLPDLEAILAKRRDPAVLAEAWAGWHAIGRPMRPMYERLVTLANEGAREIGYPDLGALWNSGYDMTPAEFERDAERLYSEVRPLYEKLHCFARAKLRAKYGKAIVPEGAPIPAHLLGNMWAQDWSNVFDLVRPFGSGPSLDVGAAMRAKKWDEKKLVATAEAFFTGLGLDPLPKTFWERSLFTKPKDREVVCHASAWDVTYAGDLRIKMCIEIEEDDLLVAHHELGHVYYFHYYQQLPILLQEGANAGFHEGIGDTLALSVTPEYLRGLGLLEKVARDPKADLDVLMKMAVHKIAFLPFGKVLDQWRWDVFAGRTPPSQYNARWWELRRQYQGIAPVSARGEEEFDPGAKYHVPAGTSYTRYFLASIYQFQFHRALCKLAGHQGPLHTCSIAGSKVAGEKLRAMLAMGASRPWPDAMEAITGERKADASALLEYFAPLAKFLEEKTKGEKCGW
jgi:peptidyl-dipeptidase A